MTSSVHEGGGLGIFSLTAVRKKFHKGLWRSGILLDLGPGAGRPTPHHSPTRGGPEQPWGWGGAVQGQGRGGDAPAVISLLKEATRAEEGGWGGGGDGGGEAAGTVCGEGSQGRVGGWS